jgi:hypothetical protein
MTLHGALTLGSNGEYVVCQACNFLSTVSAVASGLDTDLELVRSFEKCRFQEDVNFV